MRNFPITMFFLLWSACLFLDCLSWGCRCYQTYPRVVHDPFFVGNLQLQHVFFTFVFSCFRVCTKFVERPKASKFLNIRRKASASLSSQRRPRRLLLLRREIRTLSHWKMWNNLSIIHRCRFIATLKDHPDITKQNNRLFNNDLGMYFWDTSTSCIRTNHRSTMETSPSTSTSRLWRWKVSTWSKVLRHTFAEHDFNGLMDADMC